MLLLVRAMDELENILDRLDQSREKLLVAIEPLPDEALLEEGAVGQWSVADLLAILTAWEAELVTGLLRLDQGKKPTRLLQAMANREAYNKKRYTENKGRDLDRIFDDLQQVRAQLEDWLESFSSRQLTDRKRYKWFKGKSLVQIIAELSYGHEKQYIPALKAFAQKWAKRESNGPAVIPLSAVHPPEENHHDE